jgi:hypothetical protein
VATRAGEMAVVAAAIFGTESYGHEQFYGGFGRPAGAGPRWRRLWRPCRSERSGSAGLLRDNFQDSGHGGYHGGDGNGSGGGGGGESAGYGAVCLFSFFGGDGHGGSAAGDNSGLGGYGNVWGGGGGGGSSRRRTPTRRA